jgi:hypothetical protein
MTAPALDPVTNTESILKTICGTSANGQMASCQHDHRPQAQALVDLVKVGLIREWAADEDFSLEDQVAEADAIERRNREG